MKESFVYSVPSSSHYHLPEPPRAADERMKLISMSAHTCQIYEKIPSLSIELTLGHDSFLDLPPLSEEKMSGKREKYGSGKLYSNV